MNDKLFVINGQRKCSGWKNSLLNDSCGDICNYTSIWSALAYKQITKLYTTYESPWYFMLHLLPEETVCLRKNFLFRKIKKSFCFSTRLNGVIGKENIMI
jgi:hypothetical protein